MKKQILLFKSYLKYILIDGLKGMALGLFSTLIVGLIIKQIGMVLNLEILVFLGTMATVLTGAGIGIGVAGTFKQSPLILYSSAVTGFIGGYAKSILNQSAFVDSNVLLIGPGEPLGAFIAVLAGLAIGKRISKKTQIDIILTPLITIIVGGSVGLLIGPYISNFMTFLGQIIVYATEQAPLLMGIIVSTLMGMILTLPISSAALSIILGLNGLAAGAATVGCSCQMIGFAITSYRENKFSGFIALGFGSSMLQISNIVKNPKIWIPPTLTSAILGPISTVVFKMTNNPSGAGMGTSGLVGQLMTWQNMINNTSPSTLLFNIILLHFLLPAILTLLFSELLRKINWIKLNDMKLNID